MASPQQQGPLVVVVVLGTFLPHLYLVWPHTWSVCIYYSLGVETIDTTLFLEPRDNDSKALWGCLAQRPYAELSNIPN